MVRFCLRVLYLIIEVGIFLDLTIEKIIKYKIQVYVYNLLKLVCFIYFV